jgi:hypothetical protein
MNVLLILRIALHNRIGGQLPSLDRDFAGPTLRAAQEIFIKHGAARSTHSGGKTGDRAYIG